MILKSVTYRLRPDSVIIAFYRVVFASNKYSWKILFSSSAVEVPSYFIGWYIMDKWGRRWILFGTMMIGGLSCISCMFVPVGESPSLQTILHLITWQRLTPGGPLAWQWWGSSTSRSPSQSSTCTLGSWCRQSWDLRWGHFSYWIYNSHLNGLPNNDLYYSGDGSFFICCWYWVADISLH